MPTPEEVEVRLKQLAFEEKKFEATHALEREKFEADASRHDEGIVAKVSKNPAALVALVLGIVSYVQFDISSAARQQELDLARAKNEAEDDRLWRGALIGFLENQRDDLFSKDPEAKQQALAMLEACFPSRYAIAVTTKLQVLQADSGAADKKQVVRELLEPLIAQLTVSREAFDKLKPNDEENEQKIRAANQKARELLVSKAELIPEHLKKDAVALIEHYDAWFAEYDKVRGEKAMTQQAYVFAGTRGVPFPRVSAQRFRAELDKLKGP